MAYGRVLRCSLRFIFFSLSILIIGLFATETRKSESANEDKAVLCGEQTFWSPVIKMLRGTKIYGKHRGKRFLNTRILHTANGVSSFQFDRIILCGDVHPQPGPTVKRNVKYPCKECGKSVRSNQDAILCAQCKIWSHAKCIGISKEIFKHYLDNPNIDWMCGWCSLPFPVHDVDYYSEEEVDREDSDLFIQPTQNANEPGDRNCIPDYLHLQDLNDKLNVSSHKDVRIAHINVCSLRYKLDEIRCLQNHCKFEILAITETHLDSSIPDAALNIEGMKFLRLDRKPRKGGGCILYYSEYLRAVHRKDLFVEGLEAIWMQVRFPSCSVLFSVMYRPPNDGKFFELIMSPLEKAWLKTSNIILLGDFNCDLKSISTTKCDPTAAKLLHIFDALNLQNIVKEPTRETPSSSTLIDLIVTTRKDLVSSVGTHPLGISDHNLIYSTIMLKNKRPPPKIICVRQFRNFNGKKFKEDIRAAPFYVGSIFDDPDDQMWFWQQLYSDICDQHAPWKEIKIRAASAPWITNDIRLAMNRRYKLFKAAVASKSAKLWSDYKRARNKVTSDLRRAKALYFSKMFNEVRSSSAYWKLVKDATSSRVRKPIGPLKKCDDSLVLSDKEKAGLMNSFFANIGTNIAAKLPIPTGNATAAAYRSTLGDTSPPLLSRVEISPQRICRKVNELKSNKSTGPDCLSSKLLKLAGDDIVPSMYRLFDASIESESLYSSWKIAKLTPIFKKGDATEIGNYRPISLLSIPSKILESEVNDSLVHHVFKEHRLASDRQWAYRQGYSTELLLIHLTETWRMAVDSGLIVAVAFVDFRKAFDSVSHRVLLEKLRTNFGICDQALGWIAGYLDGRKQYTVVNGQNSDTMPVSVGIPQGSVLGPTLFSLFANDLPSSIKSGSVYLFADDVTIYCIKKTVDEAVAQLDKALDELYDWCILNRLTPHPQKSEAMLICKTRPMGPVAPIYIGTDAIEWVKKSRLLGITVDDKLSWVPHMLDLKKTFAKKLDLIRRSRFLPKDVLINFYFKVIFPSVTYGLVLWGSCLNADLFDSLERLHCRAARIIFNLPKDMRSSDVLLRADWHSLNHCYKLVLLKLIHKAFHDELPQVLSDNIVMKRPTGYSLRASDSLTVPRFNSIYGKNSIAHRGSVLWNILISNDKNFSSTSYKNLKKKIRSMDIFKELTFKETSTTTTNFRRKEFIYI